MKIPVNFCLSQTVKAFGRQSRLTIFSTNKREHCLSINLVNAKAKWVRNTHAYKRDENCLLTTSFHVFADEAHCFSSRKSFSPNVPRRENLHGRNKNRGESSRLWRESCRGNLHDKNNNFIVANRHDKSKNFIVINLHDWAQNFIVGIVTTKKRILSPKSWVQKTKSFTIVDLENLHDTRLTLCRESRLKICRREFLDSPVLAVY